MRIGAVAVGFHLGGLLLEELYDLHFAFGRLVHLAWALVIREKRIQNVMHRSSIRATRIKDKIDAATYASEHKLKSW